MGKYDPAPTFAAGLIRSARDMANLTQAGLAELAGMTQQAISAYETGRKYAADFKETMRIVFDDVLPQWNYRAIPSLLLDTT